MYLDHIMCMIITKYFNQSRIINQEKYFYLIVVYIYIYTATCIGLITTGNNDHCISSIYLWIRVS